MGNSFFQPPSVSESGLPNVNCLWRSIRRIRSLRQNHNPRESSFTFFCVASAFCSNRNSLEFRVPAKEKLYQSEKVTGLCLLNTFSFMDATPFWRLDYRRELTPTVPNSSPSCSARYLPPAPSASHQSQQLRKFGLECAASTQLTLCAIHIHTV